MTRRKPLQRMAALLLCVFLCLGAAFSMMGAAYAANVEPSGITIEIMLPADWAFPYRLICIFRNISGKK